MTKECKDKFMLHLQCRFSTLAGMYVKRLLSGTVTECLRMDFLLSKAAIRAMNCYNPDSDNNCIEEDDFYNMFHCLTGIFDRYNCKCNEFDFEETKQFTPTPQFVAPPFQSVPPTLQS